MRIAFTFRNLESSDALKNYATDKIKKLQKYLHSPLDAEVTLSLEGHEHCIDINLTSSGHVYMGTDASEDMYASIDRVTDKIRTQVARNKAAQTTRRRSAPGVRVVASQVAEEET